MAERRMFANSVIDSDAFLDMPLSAQALYFHLGMKADDDGFVGGPKKIQRMVAASEDDLRLLILKGFVIPFETGVCVITHWKLHNYIQKDRYRPTIYNVERDQLELAANKMYELCAQGVSKLDTGCSQDVSKLDAQVSVGKGRKEEVILEAEKPPKKTRFVPPSLEEVAAYCRERGNNVDPHRFLDHYTASGWMRGKTPVKDWKACVRTWERQTAGESPAEEPRRVTGYQVDTDGTVVFT